jgi:hypothetical protein
MEESGGMHSRISVGKPEGERRLGDKDVGACIILK